MSRKLIKRLAVGFVAAIALVTGFSAAAHAAGSANSNSTASVSAEQPAGPGWD